MVAFSHHHHHTFLLDNSVFLQNPLMKTSIEKSNDTSNYSCQFFQLDDPLQKILMDGKLNENSSLEDVIKHSLSNNEPTVTNNKHSNDSSSMVGKVETGAKVTQKVTPMNKKRKYRNDSSLCYQTETPARQLKEKKQNKCKRSLNDTDKKQPRAYNKDNKVEKKTPKEVPTGYIHVKARRGQATDSHSLAERVRREKISERMKLLQALVPGCDKVTGKALMLDEIINYVQSLQNQVEFLSMKLASINHIQYDFSMDLEAFMLTPEMLNSIVPPLPNVQNCSLTQPSTISGTINNFPIGNDYALLDTSSSSLFQQGKMPINLPEGEGQLLCNMNDQIQKFINQSDFSNNLCSFH